MLVAMTISPLPGLSGLCFLVFLVFCVLVFFDYCYFMLSLTVQFIAWKDCPQDDLLCVERNVKQLLADSLTV